LCPTGRNQDIAKHLKYAILLVFLKVFRLGKLAALLRRILMLQTWQFLVLRQKIRLII